MITQSGKAMISLGDLVDNFCLEQGNMREAFITKILLHAKWTWKDIFRTSIMGSRTQVFTHHGHGKIKLPDNCERVYNVSVVDHCGIMHPLTFDPDYNTTEIRCNQTCSCTNCNGQNSLCGAVDNLTATQTFKLYYPPAPAPPGPGVSLPTTTWVITNACGDVQTVTKYPVPLWNGTFFVKVQSWETVSQTVCNLDVDSNGCIRPTEANIAMMGQYLSDYGFNPGSYDGFAYRGPDTYHRELLGPQYNYYGFWNYNTANGQIIHVFRNSQCPNCHRQDCCDGSHDQNNIGSVIVSFLTNGEEPGTEILVPEYAYDAMVIGIRYRQELLAMRPGVRIAGEFQRMYVDAKFQIAKYLNPLRMEDVYKMQSQKMLM